jgi:hypothetical protein
MDIVPELSALHEKLLFRHCRQLVGCRQLKLAFGYPQFVTDIQALLLLGTFVCDSRFDFEKRNI